MSFKMKYQIEAQYLPPNSLRRPSILMPYVGFIVGHDTGNDGTTAQSNVSYYRDSANQVEASAQTFVDDKHIIECIPATTGVPEKAWHVIYNVTTDNQQFGDDANDIAIGVELCYSKNEGNINNAESYKRYVWYIAYLCYKFNLNPKTKITGHKFLDPQHRTDPLNAFGVMGITWDGFIQDVVNEFNACKQVVQPVFFVCQNENKLKEFVDQSEAVEYAKQWANASVRRISNGEWVWDNYPKVQTQPVAPTPVPQSQPKPQNEVRKLDEGTKQRAMTAIDELHQAGLLDSPDYWKAKVEENLPVWAYMLIESRKLKK